MISVASYSSTLPEPARTQARDLLRDYTKDIINDEWNLMGAGRIDALPAVSNLNNLWAIYQQIPSDSVKAAALESLDTLNRWRELRLLDSDKSLPTLSWALLSCGEIVFISLCLLFHMENRKLHLLLTAILTGYTSFCLLFIFVLNSPYFGDIHVDSEDFIHALYFINTLPK